MCVDTFAAIGRPLLRLPQIPFLSDCCGLTVN
jgi:hypothetical protein